MSNLGRRDFLQRSAALLPLTALAAQAAGSNRLKSFGFQLYTLRNVIKNDPAGMLSTVEKDGYTEIEGVYALLDTVATPLKSTKLKPVSVHIDSALFGDDAKIEQALEKVHAMGFQYAVYPYMPVPERGGPETIKKLADKLNKAGAQAKKLGMHVCYHNHAFEFKPEGSGYPLQSLLSETDKSLVSLELDVFWVSVAGHNPSELIKQYADRIKLVHLKDKLKGFPVQFNENVPKDTFKEVGQGSVDFPNVLRAAKAAGVQHYFVEQDQTAGDPLASLKLSADYLRKVTF